VGTEEIPTSRKEREKWGTRPQRAQSKTAYNSFMARGWESKSVEAQQAEVAEKPGPKRVAMTPSEAARQRKLESLRLSRQNILQQLERAHDPRHRRMLEEALAELQHRMDSAKRQV
jgi:hypothetical protein